MKLSRHEFRIENLSTYLEETKEISPTPVTTYLMIWINTPFVLPDSTQTIYCLQVHQLHELALSYALNGIVISFSKNFLEAINGFTYPPYEEHLFTPYSPVSLSLEVSKQHSLGAILQAIKNENEQETLTENQNEIVKVLFKLFLLRLAECKNVSSDRLRNKEEMFLVKKYLDLIQSHFMEWKRVSDYANELCVTPNYLNAKIKKITGFTASYHIQQRIILEAKRQARWRGLCMKEVAHHLGFDDLSHFSKFFKNAAGINFSTYLKAEVL